MSSTSTPVLAFNVFQSIYAFLEKHPSLRISLQFTQIQQFLILGQRLFHSLGVLEIPFELPVEMQKFLAEVLHVDLNTIQLCWAGLKDVIAIMDPLNIIEQDNLFRTYGPALAVGASIPSFVEHVSQIPSTGALILSPPFQQCPHDTCEHQSLVDEISLECRLFTLRRGVLPVVATSKYCRCTLLNCGPGFGI